MAKREYVSCARFKFDSKDINKPLELVGTTVDGLDIDNIVVNFMEHIGAKKRDETSDE